MAQPLSRAYVDLSCSIYCDRESSSCIDPGQGSPGPVLGHRSGDKCSVGVSNSLSTAYRGVCGIQKPALWLNYRVGIIWFYLLKDT